MKIKGVIFDMDGTLLDSMYIWDTCASEYIKRQDRIPEKDLNKKISHMTFSQGVEYLIENYFPEKSYGEIEAGVYDIIREEYINNAPAKSGVAEAIRSLAGMGIKMAVATANDLDLAQAALIRCGIYNYFEGIVTCRMVGQSKESPCVYYKAQELLGLQTEDVAVVEDVLYAVKTAKGAGFRTVAIKDDYSKADRDAIIGFADCYIPSFEDWQAILGN
ncbi:MAG: HAD family phosphatase [Clostridiaceae bacterium]|nr:HAD family phosphatase [Clostridiaceae bacterium]